MAEGLYSAGKVGVDVVPDTSRFWAILNAELHTRNPQVGVGVDVNDAGYQAWASRTDGRTLTNSIKIDGDYSGLHQLAQQMDAIERQSRTMQRQTVADMQESRTKFLAGLNSMRNNWGTANKRVREEWAKTHDALDVPLPTSKLGAEMEAAAYKTAALVEKHEDYQKVLDELTGKQAEQWAKLRAEEEKTASERKRLTDEQIANEQRLAEAVTRTNKQRGAWAAQSVQAQKRLAKAQADLSAAQAAGDKEAANAARERVKVESQRIRQYERNTNAAVKALQKLQRESDKLSQSIDRQLSQLDKTADKTAKSVQKALKPLDDSVAKTLEKNQSMFAAATRQMVEGLKQTAEQSRQTFESSGPFTFLRNLQTDSAQAAAELDKLREAESETARTHDMLTKAMGASLEQYGAVNNAQKSLDHAFASSAITEHQTKVADLTRLFNEQEDQLEALISQFTRAKKYGIGLDDEFGDMGKSINNAMRTLRNFRDYAAKHPVKAEAKLDRTEWEKSFGEIIADANELARKLDRKHEIEVRVTRWQDDADRLEERLFDLEHTRLDIPADFKLDERNIISRMREVAAQIKANPELAPELEADLELDMKRAEERLREFQRKNKELKMDLDLETALARAHLAYFTRPRTIDIFANFKGTDAGKIINGMLSGATGLKGVENQFQRLVNLMDSLDTTVPKLTMLGSVFTAIGAGAVNLAGSVGGAGSSLVSLAKAAYAAPAALGTVAAGFYGVYAASKVASDRFKLANTELKDLQESVGNAFWDEAADSITGMSNALGADFIRNMREVSAEEGRMAAGMADIIMQANAAGRINAMLDHAAMSVRNLTPGVESAVDAFTSLGRVGGQYVPQLTNWISNNLTVFAEWARTVESDNARVETAMGKVREQAGYLGSSIGSLKGVVTGVFGAFSQYENGLQGFSEAVAKADRAVNSVSFQTTISAWVTGAQEAQTIVRDSFSHIGADANSLRENVRRAFMDAGVIVGSTLENISRLLATSGDGMSVFTDNVASGWQRFMSAVGDSGPAFSDMLSMVGKLSNTFGGTLASGLRAATPMLQVIANVTGTVADAFDRLPEPVKAAAALWVTFGRAGKSAIDSLKMGMLTNIQQTLQYRSTMQQLGVATKGTSVSIRELVAAMAQLQRGQVAGALSGATTSIRQIGASAVQAAAEINGMGPAFQKAGTSAIVVTKGMSGWDAAIGSTESKVASLAGRFEGVAAGARNAGSVLVEALGGWQTIGVTAAIAAVTTVVASYSEHVAKAEAQQESFNEAMKATPGAIGKASEGLNNFSATVNDMLGEDLDFWDKFTPSTTMMGDFKSASDALQALGISTEEAATAASGTNKQYEQMKNRLDKIASTDTTTLDTSQVLGKNGTAAYQASQKLEEYRQQQIDLLKTTAEAQGKSADWVDSLLNQGQSIQSVSLALADATEKTQLQAQASQKLTSMLDKERSARISLASASSSYARTLEGMQSTIQQVNQLAAQGQRVWADTATGFDMTTEAGRTASDALATLATNANAYLDAMIESGAGVDEVTAKQNELRGQLGSTANQLTNNAAGAADYAQSLLMTPSDVKTKITLESEQAKTAMLEYLQLVQVLFPNGTRDQTYKALMKAVVEGKVDVNQLSSIVQQLADGKHTVVLTADGTPVVTTIDWAKQYAKENAEGQYTTTLDADDFASGKIEDLTNTLESSGLDKKQIMLLLNAEGNAKWEILDVRGNLEALGMEPKTYEWLLNGNGTAEERFNAVKTSLSWLNLSDKEIQWILDCIDNARDKMVRAEDLQKRLGKGVSFNIEADDDDAQVKLASYLENDGKTIATSNVRIEGEDNTSNATESAKTNISSIPREWWAMLYGSDGISSAATTAQLAIQAIPTLWQSIMQGSDMTSGPANAANNAVRTIPAQWQSNLFGTGNTTPFAGQATMAVKSIPTVWQSTMNGGGSTPSFAGQAGAAVRQVPSYSYTTLDAGGSALRVTGSILDNLRSIAGRAWTAVVNTVTGGGHAEGGRILGPGTATSDSIPAWLSNGEMVIKASSVRKLDAKYGRSFLNALNAYGDAEQAMRPSRFALNARRMNQAYAAGGRVHAINSGDITLEVNPVVKVELPKQEASTTITNNVRIDGVGTSDSRIVDAVQTVIEAAARGRNMRVN